MTLIHSFKAIRITFLEWKCENLKPKYCNDIEMPWLSSMPRLKGEVIGAFLGYVSSNEMRLLQISDSKLGLSPDSARDRLSRVNLNLGLSPKQKKKKRKKHHLAKAHFNIIGPFRLNPSFV